MANLVTKYKERSPEETIEIIKSFFINAGYEISFYNVTRSEAQTYSCSVSIYKDSIFYLTAHGKGVTELFCKASACAELYERFCNKCEFNRHPFVLQDMQNKSYSQYGYHINKLEKTLSYDEIMNVPCIRNYFTYHWETDNLIQNYFQLFFGQNIIGEPFIDLMDSNNTPYYNQSILNRAITSVGMCAGNTIEEALNQGLSEICEHMIEDKFLTEEQDCYYIVNPECLNDELQNKIKSIEASGSKIFIFDLSYNFKMPVVMSLLINQKHKLTNINFGSFPVFDIAVERIITELYQGIESFNFFNPEQIQIPWHNSDFIPDGRNSLTEFSTFNEEILLSKSKNVTQSSDIFIQNIDNLTNADLNLYFINLFKLFNYSIHYIDNSLCKDIKALYIIIPEYNYADSFFVQNEQYNEYKQYNLITMAKIHKLMHQIYNTNINDNEFTMRIQEIQQRMYREEHDGALCGIFMFADWLNPVPQRVGEIIWNYNEGMYDIPNNTNSIFYPTIKYYATLQQYKNANYSFNQVQNIFKIMFNTEVSTEDYARCDDASYLSRKIHIDTIQHYINSEGYQSFLEDNIKKE